MTRTKSTEIVAADRDKQLENVHSIGFWLLAGKKPGKYVEREPLLHAWREFHTRLDDVGPRIRPEELVDHERDFDPRPAPSPPPASETRIAVRDAGRVGRRNCTICQAPFVTRNYSQVACSRLCGGQYRAQKRLGAVLAEQKARVKALRCSHTTPIASASELPPSASPDAPSADSPAQAATASGS